MCVHVYREVDDGAVGECWAQNAAQNAFRLRIDHRHDLVNDDHLGPLQYHSRYAHELCTQTRSIQATVTNVTNVTKVTAVTAVTAPTPVTTVTT